MIFARPTLIALFALCGTTLASAQPMSLEEFRNELVGAPLCGTPDYGPYAGKMLCTVHLPDGTAVMAGQGLVVRGTWEVDNGKICRKNAQDPLERRRCIAYEKVGQDRYRNSDGINLCIGPCP